MAFTPVVTGQTVHEDMWNQLIEAWEGAVAGGSHPLLLTKVNDALNYAMDVQQNNAAGLLGRWLNHLGQTVLILIKDKLTIGQNVDVAAGKTIDGLDLSVHGHTGAAGHGVQLGVDAIAADAVDGTKIADDAVDSEHYVDGSIDAAHIAGSAVTNTKIANDAVRGQHIQAGQVDTAELAADAVTGAKIADDAVDSEHYVDGSIDREHLAADVIDGTRLADDAVDSAHYVDGSIDAAHIAGSAVTNTKIANDAVRGQHIQAGQVDTAELAADAVTGAKIADDAVDSEHYVDGSIDTAHIGDSQITAAKIANRTRKFFVQAATGVEGANDLIMKSHLGLRLEDNVTSYAYGSFVIPMDYAAGLTVTPVILPDATGNIQIQTNVFGAACGVAPTQKGTLGPAAIGVMINQWNCIQAVTPAPIVVGDVMTVDTSRVGGAGADTVNARCYIPGWIVEYTADS